MRAGTELTVLVYEWVTGGGLAGLPMPNGWAAEGAAIELYIGWCRHPAEERVRVTKVGTAHWLSVQWQRDRRQPLDIAHPPLYTIPPTLFNRRPSTVSQAKTEKAKLLARVRRVRGQVEAVERALVDEKGCATVLHLIVAARGAMSSLMTEVIEDHIRVHVVDPARDAERSRGAEELIEAVQAYLK